jgi:hypothetical protein
LPRLEDALGTEQQDPEHNVSRRQALKRMAAVGGAVWVAPALQTINMSRAQAGTPRQNCFSVAVTAGNKCEEPGPSGQGFHCLTPVTTPLGGCGHVTVVSTNGGASWVIDLGSCSFLEGQVKSGGGSGSCCPINIAPGTTGVITIPRCATGPHGQLQDISGVEITFCCPTA